MLKRSLTISGHRTSIALEAEFWSVLDRIAEQQDLSVSQLIARIDEDRDEPNLSSAIRVFALDWALSQGIAQKV